MREIKFDAIYKPTGEHFTPHEINFNDNTITGNFDGQINDWCHFSFDGNYGDVILRQYVGRKDINGKEIYRGDVVKYLDGYDCSTENGIDFEEFDNIGVIEWEEQELRYYVTNRQSIDLESFWESDEIEVIGNIYQNTELLEVQHDSK